VKAQKFRSAIRYVTSGSRGIQFHKIDSWGSAMRPAEQFGSEQLVWMYTQMLRIREFEERVKRTFVEHPGVIRGHSHLGDGAEASIVGALATRKSGDPVMPSYRCHG
jgi:TPP-dependent pyruvate/acetoin dehydrogenase alpha subunit